MKENIKPATGRLGVLVVYYTDGHNTHGEQRRKAD